MLPMETKVRPTRGYSIRATICSHWFRSGLYTSAKLITSFSAWPPVTKISCPKRAAARSEQGNDVTLTSVVSSNAPPQNYNMTTPKRFGRNWGKLVLIRSISIYIYKIWGGGAWQSQHTGRILKTCSYLHLPLEHTCRPLFPTSC